MTVYVINVYSYLMIYSSLNTILFARLESSLDILAKFIRNL